MQSAFQNRWRVAAKCGFALLLFQWCGCAAHLATVKTEPARLPTGLRVEEPLESATKYLIAAEREQPSTALGHDLLAAKISYGVLERQPKNESARSIYNFAVARVVQDVDRTDLEPWRHPVTVVTDEGRYTLVSPKPVDADHDPSRYDLFPTDTLKIGGQFFKTYSTVSGIGAPIAVVGRTESPLFRQQYKLHRIYAPITAIVRFSGRKASLEFMDPLNAERITLNKQTFPLAADFDAPTALLIARERPERLGLSRVLNPEAYADTAMLTRLQQFDPARTPVIFVHGLQETGASWAPMIDSLRHDPTIRRHYQFWYFSYPSGYPLPYAAALFRHDLDGIERAFPNHKRIVLIGHSMGGMICRLMITDAGDKIWRDFFGTPPAKTPLASDTRKLLEQALVFDHRPDVQRVIFISTPHRGSELASNWIGRIGAALVRTPRLFTSIYASTKPLLIADPAARPLNRMPNSVDTLEPNDRFVEAVNKLPITRGIPYHSIIGDRGRGDTPNSSDGVVPYWSSHLPGAQSELIVNSDHGAQYNPQAIREVERILKLNLSHSALRRFPEALRKLDQVLNITPDDLDTLAVKAAIGQAEGDLPRAAALLATLHPNADDSNALETQVYQAILERRPAPMIARLKEILAKPDPTLGYINGELRFWLGWAQEVAGDHAAAQESWRQARSELEPFLEEQPENSSLIDDLVLTNMGLGDKATAFKLIERAMAAVPIEKDAAEGAAPIEFLARVAAGTGEPDRAIAALQKLLSIPYESRLASNVPLTPALLRLDPMFDPLRNDPRFQKLAASSASKPTDK